MPENCAAIIDTLIEQRKEKGMTQEDLAQATHLTQSVIARMEGKRTCLLYTSIMTCMA